MCTKSRAFYTKCTIFVFAAPLTYMLIVVIDQEAVGTEGVRIFFTVTFSAIFVIDKASHVLFNIFL